MLLSTVARAIDCNEDEDGANRLDDFPEIICWTGTHTRYQLISLVFPPFNRIDDVIAALKQCCSGVTSTT